MYDINNFGQEIRLHKHASFKELASAPADAAGYGQLYAKASGVFYKEGGSSTENQLQYYSAVLDELKNLSFSSDGEIIVYDTGALTVQSGATARSSLGLGVADDVEFNSVTVEDMTVNGTLTTVSQENLNISNLFVTVNDGETGSGITAPGGVAGIEVDRGIETNYRILFDESDDLFKAGFTGNEQIVTFRTASPFDTGIAFWNAAAGEIVTDSDFYIDTLNTRLYIGGEYIDSTRITNWNSGTGSSYNAGLNINATELGLGNIATVSSPTFDDITVDNLAGAIAVIGVTAGGSLSLSVNSDHLNEGTSHLFRSGSNKTALETDYGTPIFDTGADTSDDITEGTTNLFRSGTDATALLTDYAVDVTDFINVGDLFNLSAGTGISIDTAGTYAPETAGSSISVDLVDYFDASSVILGEGVYWDGVLSTIRVTLVPFTLDGSAVTNASDVLIKNGKLIIDIDDLNISPSSNGWTTINDDFSGQAVAEQAGDELTFASGVGAIVEVSDTLNNAQVKVSIAAAVNHTTSIVQNSGSIAIGDDDYKSMIVDYYYVNQSEYQEGTIRIIEVGGSYEYTHEYQSTTDMMLTWGSVTASGGNLNMSYNNTYGSVGTITWIYRGVIA